MGRWYNDTPEVSFPELFFEVSCLAEHVLRKNDIAYSRAEFCWLRRNVLRSLECAGITQQNYDPRRSFYVVGDATMLAVFDMYGMDKLRIKSHTSRPEI